MKGKLIFTLGFAGILAVSFGFAKDFQNTKVSAEVSSKQTDTYKLVTREEQDRREGKVGKGKGVTTVITVEEQNMVENSLIQQGFVPQENGTGFYFEKEKFGFAKDFQNTKASAEVSSKQTDTYKLVTREEQDRREGKVGKGKDVTTVITVEEQNMVENSSIQQGFVPQENGTGFYFKKEKK